MYTMEPVKLFCQRDNIQLLKKNRTLNNEDTSKTNWIGNILRGAGGVSKISSEWARYVSFPT